MTVRLLLTIYLIPTIAGAQGFAGLGAEAGDFAPVTAPAALSFPADHAAHPAFRIEWWYLTAVLEGPDGAEMGAQWTLFRQAADPGPEAAGWASNQIWMAHAAVTTAADHRHAETFARGGVGQAGVALNDGAPFRAWIDDWAMTSTVADPGADPLDALAVTATGADFAFDLRVEAQGPLVLHGEAGFSLKAPTGQASYYYSQPFYSVNGTVTLDGAAVPVTGTAWLDREWSSQPLEADQEGWDWFALHLDDGTRVMVAELRGAAPYRIGTWIAADGVATALASEEIVLAPRAWAEVAGREVPVEWRIEIPSRGLAVDTEAVNPQSWMDTVFPYWEGPIRVAGSHAGRGYLEMTGYAP